MGTNVWRPAVFRGLNEVGVYIISLLVKSLINVNNQSYCLVFAKKNVLWSENDWATDRLFFGDECKFRYLIAIVTFFIIKTGNPY